MIHADMQGVFTISEQDIETVEAIKTKTEATKIGATGQFLQTLKSLKIKE